MRTPVICFSTVLVSLGILAGARAAEPDVDSIIKKSIEASGGKEAMQKITSRVVKFKMESEMMGQSTGEIFSKAPNKQLSNIEISGTGTMNEGFDGKVAWAKTPWEGLRVKSGEELAKTKRDAALHKELNFKESYPDLAYKGKEKDGEEEVYVLESKPTPSSKERFLFSTKSGLLVKQASQFEGPQGPVNLSIALTDYKAFDELKYPTQMKIKFSAGGADFEFTMKVLEVKHNVPIADEKFAKPAA